MKHILLIFCYFSVISLNLFSTCNAIDEQYGVEAEIAEIKRLHQAIIDTTTNLDDKKSLIKQFTAWQAEHQNDEINIYAEESRRLAEVIKLRKSQQYVIDATANLDNKKSIMEEFAAWREKHQNDTVDVYIKESTRLNEAYDELIKKLFSNIITNKELIDKSQALNTLKNCDDTYCKLYKAYFLATTGKENEARAIMEPFIASEKAKNQSNYFYHYLHRYYYDPEYSDKDKDYKISIIYFIQRHIMYYLNDYGEDNNYHKIPYWMIIETPEVLNCDDAHCPLLYTPAEVNQSISTLPNYKKFSKISDNIGICEGSICLFYDAQLDSFSRKAMLAPSLIVDPMTSINSEKFLQLVFWSYQGIWNRYKYLQLEDYSKLISKDLENFYLNNNKADYAPKAREIIEDYIRIKFIRFDDTYKNFFNQKAVQIFTKIHQLSELKTLTKDFSPDDFSIALKIAILNNYDVEIIKWLIEQGADANFVHYCENILMSAVTRPEIVKILLDNKANVNAQNSFGKTALFYAIQFNNLESVKILLKAGADINHQLLSNDKINSSTCDFYININIVSNFTPLAYAKKYGSKELIDFLEAAGAKLIISEEDLQRWLEIE